MCIGQLAERSPGVPHATQAHVFLGSSDFTPCRDSGAPEPYFPLNGEPLTRQPRRGLTGRSGLS
eukprot:5766475-Alexandrium_andersonii.AAC.1